MKSNLPVTLSESMVGEKLTDAATTAADIGLDAVIASGAFDGVPIFGAMTSLYRGGAAVRDYLFAKKIAKFLVTFNETPAGDRSAFIRRLEEQGKTVEFSEQLLLLLERMEDMQKPTILANIMAAAAKGALPLDKALRLAKILDRAFSEDLQTLSTLQSGVASDGVPAASLFSSGLLLDKGLPGTIVDESGGGETTYELNEYGELMRDFGLKPSTKP